MLLLIIRQLTIAQERLSSARGGVLIESLYEKDLAEKSAALVREIHVHNYSQFSFYVILCYVCAGANYS